MLVNGAGMSQVRSLEALTDEEWQAMWELHVMAPMRLMRAAIPEMAERGWGRIVNVSSSSGKRPGQRNVAYSVTKAAQLSLSRAFADALCRQRRAHQRRDAGPGRQRAVARAGRSRRPDRRGPGRHAPGGAGRGGGRPAHPPPRAPEEIAAVIVFLCSDLASNVAGAAWSVDGGAVPVII